MTETQHKAGSWETITAALEQASGPGRPSGEWVKFCCPVHESGGGHHNPSLAVKYLPAEQKTKVKCFAGCDDRDILGTLGLKVRDLYDNPITRSTRDSRRARAPRVRPRQISPADRAIDAAGLPLTQPKKEMGEQLSPWRLTDAYPYMRADGEIAGEVVRKEADFERGRDKKFTQRRWNTQTGEFEPGGFEALPFQLPQLLEGIRNGRWVYVCEGEKDVLNAEKAGLCATTNAGGALSWTPEHARYLHGAVGVVIVADHDTPGYRRAGKVLDSLAGLAGQVRVVQAATGKDLTDHINAGHGIDELEPIPYLDPRTTRAVPAPALSPVELAESAGRISAADLLPAHTHPTPDGGLTMSQSGFFNTDAPHQHDDTVDHVGQHFSRFMQQLLQTLIVIAQKNAERRRREADEARFKSLEAEQEYLARMAAEQKAVETRLTAMAKAGWDRSSRSDIASAIRDAFEWAPDSEVAKRALKDLVGHVDQRYGVHVDTLGGHVTLNAPELAAQLAGVERDRAVANRVHTARDRMVEIVAADKDIAESAKRELYTNIDDWKRNPSGHSLQELTKKVTAAGLNEKARNKIRFVAAYLGTPDGQIPINELGAVAALSATSELRKTTEPLVDPAEEVKPRIDDMLVRYQDRLRHGVNPESITKQLTAAVNLLPSDEQTAARQRGTDIRANPAAEFKPLWPNHVDRDQLDAVVRMYAAMAPQVEAMAVHDEPFDEDVRAQMRKQADKHRRTIEHAIAKGEGLHELERDQLKAVLADIDAGITDVPEQLFADDRSAAAVDASRSDEIAHQSSVYHRRQLDEILSSGAVPSGAARAAGDEIASVFDAQTQLAAGNTSLADYEYRDTDAKLIARLAAAGVPEPIRNQVKNHIDHAAGQCAIAGKQARRIQDRWSARREMVSANRTPEPIDYDSPERRASTEAGLRAAGLSDRTVRGRMAADAGHATPPSAAVNSKPGAQGKGRTTKPGSGVHRSTHRGRGDQRGYGK